MPGRVRVKILSARNLPVMDRASYSTDAFVELKLGGTAYKTEVARRSLNPQWNTEWYKFELDDEELQDEALQIRVLDYDTYSAHDAIGKVYIDLNPLLGKDGSRSMSGWFPLYDTMHGIRGDIQISLSLDLFSDSNRYRESSLGVRFFYHPGVPSGHSLIHLLGFVEELVVNDDPEYEWMEKLRTSRASNEARQRLFSQLNGQLQRKLGLRVLGMGGNAVIGYRLHFDLEGESGIVVRGIGTAVSLGASSCTAPTAAGAPPASPTKLTTAAAAAAAAASTSISASETTTTTESSPPPQPLLSSSLSSTDGGGSVSRPPGLSDSDQQQQQQLLLQTLSPSQPPPFQQQQQQQQGFKFAEAVRLLTSATTISSTISGVGSVRDDKDNNNYSEKLLELGFDVET